MDAQYMAAKVVRINGVDYQPGELVRDPGALRNPGLLLAARIIAPAVAGAVPPPGPDVEPEPVLEPEGEAEDPRTEWETDLLGLTRDGLDALARDYGVEHPERLPNKPAVVAAIAALLDGDPEDEEDPDDG